MPSSGSPPRPTPPPARDSAAALRTLFASRLAILDGAMGTMIQAHPLTEGDFRGARFRDHAHDLRGNNDLLCLTRPDIIEGIHREYFAAGADLVIGHHPHVLQGFEAYKGRLIAYSLGDLVFDHFSVATGQTVLVDAVLTPGGVKATLVPVYVSSSGIPAVQTGGAATTILSLVRQYSKALGTSVVIKGDVATVRAGK